MKKLSIRKRGGRSFELGPASGKPGDGPTVMVTASNKKEALSSGKPEWKRKYDTRATRTGA